LTQIEGYFYPKPLLQNLHPQVLVLDGASLGHTEVSMKMPVQTDLTLLFSNKAFLDLSFPLQWYKRLDFNIGRIG
jgi:hypothetical protein